MKLKNLISALSVCSSILSFGQTASYHAIDSLLETHNSGNASMALEKLKEKQLTDESRPEFWTRYSKASLGTNKPEDARTAMRKALSLDPTNAELFFEKGMLCNMLGELDTARRVFEQAIGIRPEGKYYYWKGIVNQQLGNSENAEMDYRYAIDKKFETAELYNNLSILLMAKENFEGSLEAVNKAVAMDKNYPQAISLRARVYCFLFKVDSACIEGKRALAMGYNKAFMLPDSICEADSITQLDFTAQVLAFNKMYRRALKGYSRLIAAGILTSANFLNRGYCYYQQKDYANAEKDYLQALALPNPNKDLLWDNLSLLYYDQGNYQKSIEYSTKRVELNPKNHVPYIDRGLCYRILKKYKEAEKDFNQSLAIKPDFYRALGYRSFLYYDLGQYQKALEDASMAIQINPRYDFGYMRRASAKRALGQTDFCLDLYYAQKYGDRDAEKAIKEFCK
ncbi:MAG TPA: tetratricopeptide repeat protein [Chitinophagaceae bacterium]|nr:tetratricopeptide repeat protein [Chitinophagaceae bacterium]